MRCSFAYYCANEFKPLRFWAQLSRFLASWQASCRQFAKLQILRLFPKPEGRAPFPLGGTLKPGGAAAIPGRPVVCWDSPCAGPRRSLAGYVRSFILFSASLPATS